MGPAGASEGLITPERENLLSPVYGAAVGWGAWGVIVYPCISAPARSSLSGGPLAPLSQLPLGDITSVP